MGLGKKIIQFREQRGWTQKHLASKANMSQASLHYIETEENSPTLNTLNKLAVALDISVAELLEEDDECKAG